VQLLLAASSSRSLAEHCMRLGVARVLCVCPLLVSRTVGMSSPGTPVTRAARLTDGLSAFAHTMATPPLDSTPAKGEAAAPQSATKSNASRKRKIILDTPPTDWRETWDLIIELRSDRTAVVDSMGCESAAAVCADDNERAYHSLISLMLSSQTKDTMNFLVMTRLREWGLSVASVSAVPEDRLRELIYGVGFHNNKVKHIKASTEIIIDQHGGRVPATLDELLALPGVGPKMALIQMNVAVGQCVGISVDTHVHRISNQLGWTGDTATKQPEKTREALESWMPRDVWPHINLVMVGLGQEVQTEKTKLLRKCVACSDPPRALELMTKLGLDIDKEMKKAGLALSPLRS